ncbi:ABC transporter permease [Peribacillus cavernae]|uniref:ABC transporter permease n=1 Tax=Peribacillus cavernae TaxID=1674310 RepID=A0A433HTE2_9BACI|nr:ABC transporter permease [Peribacillus cavernae]MDQ0218604.1 peptide/nickel transport system permease protein [Peribacillus cavernae]RUQ31589.1 ABC transporter permease [Peribacillus cavernae]
MPSLVNETSNVKSFTTRKRKTLFSQIFKSRTGVLGLFILTLVVLIALLAPFISPHDPAKVDITATLLPPSWVEGGSAEHLLGTDNMGRDLLSRIIYGSQISLLVGISSVVVAGLIGVLIGLVSGYYGGWIDNVLMRIVDAFLSIPNILFTLVILGIFGPSLITLILVIGATNWVNYARIVRSEVLSLKEREFVKAAKTMGVRDFFILFRHLLPNVVSSLSVVSTLSVATTIILEASLSFLGLGIKPPDVSWGGILSDGRDYLATHWWVATFPGLAITITVLGIILVGDWLRDIFDPRSNIQNDI